MADARSPAGALGLMQIMPATGRQIARSLNTRLRNRYQLLDADVSLRFGTTYLRGLLDRLDRHPALATAAYNAGPHRVDQWLPEGVSEDTRAWIENIPFNETRNYVKKVMAAKAIFHWRMTGDVWRLSEELGRVIAPEELQLAAR